MNDMRQVAENIESADRSCPHGLTGDEIGLIHKVRETYLEKTAIQCSSCGYCMPCPRGVFIPRIFEFYNEAMMFDDMHGGQMRYNSWIEPGQKAASCAQCGECVEKCPRRIDIPDWLRKAHKLLNYGNAS